MYYLEQFRATVCKGMYLFHREMPKLSRMFQFHNQMRALKATLALNLLCWERFQGGGENFFRMRREGKNTLKYLVTKCKMTKASNLRGQKEVLVLK